MRNTFSVLFYLKRKGVRRDGKAPIMGRVTVDGRMASFSTHRFVPPSSWDQARQRMRGRSREAAEINRDLQDIGYAAAREYRRMVSAGANCTPQAIRASCAGSGSEQPGLLETFDRHNETLLREVGFGRSRSTYNKYVSVRNHLKTFIAEKYKRCDMSFADLNAGFVREFVLWLAARGCASSTIWLYIMPLKKLIAQARRRGVQVSDPFEEYGIPAPRPERRYLNPQELKRLIKYSPSDPRLAAVRKLFLFACFTGLSYCDVKGIKYENLRRSFDGKLWIVMRRQKNRNALRIPLLDFPRRILSAEIGSRPSGLLFRVPGNHACNAALERISAEAGIVPKFTFHCARHTFATTVTLSKGVPIETVSALLGHRSIQTTQIYAAVVDDKVRSDMRALSAKWKAIEKNMPSFET